jgi:hypothetical protein
MGNSTQGLTGQCHWHAIMILADKCVSLGGTALAHHHHKTPSPSHAAGPSTSMGPAPSPRSTPQKPWHAWPVTSTESASHGSCVMPAEVLAPSCWSEKSPSDEGEERRARSDPSLGPMVAARSPIQPGPLPRRRREWPILGRDESSFDVGCKLRPSVCVHGEMR